MTVQRYTITDLPSNAERELFKEGYRERDEILDYLMNRHKMLHIADLDCGMYIDPNNPEKNSHQIGSVLIYRDIPHFLIQFFYVLGESDVETYPYIKCASIFDEQKFGTLIIDRKRKSPNPRVFGSENHTGLAEIASGGPMNSGIINQIRLDFPKSGNYKKIVDCFLGRVVDLVKRSETHCFNNVRGYSNRKLLFVTLMPEIIKSSEIGRHTEKGDELWRGIVDSTISAYRKITSNAEFIWHKKI